jgi:hypothetical protein
MRRIVHALEPASFFHSVEVRIADADLSAASEARIVLPHQGVEKRAPELRGNLHQFAFP